jgi:hypothetical protein
MTQPLSAEEASRRAKDALIECHMKAAEENIHGEMCERDDCPECVAVHAASMDADAKHDAAIDLLALAARCEQAEYTAKESLNAVSLKGLQDFLEHLAARSRREMQERGK